MTKETVHSFGVLMPRRLKSLMCHEKDTFARFVTYLVIILKIVRRRAENTCVEFVISRDTTSETVLKDKAIHEKLHHVKKKKSHYYSCILTCKIVSSCWFCLANPKVEKHLIVSIGDELYATLAKGPVVSDSPVPGKGHLLIVPINHFPTFGKVPPEAQARVVEELKNYKQAIKQFFAKYDQDMVIFEVSRESARGVSHALLQVIPIPKSKSDQVEKVARELGDAAGMQFIDQIPVSTIT